MASSDNAFSPVADDAPAAELGGGDRSVDGHSGHGVSALAVEDVVNVHLHVVPTQVRAHLDRVVGDRVYDRDSGGENAVGIRLDDGRIVEFTDRGDDVDRLAAGVVRRLDVRPVNGLTYRGKVARLTRALDRLEQLAGDERLVDLDGRTGTGLSFDGELANALGHGADLGARDLRGAEAFVRQAFGVATGRCQVKLVGLVLEVDRDTAVLVEVIVADPRQAGRRSTRVRDHAALAVPDDVILLDDRACGVGGQENAGAVMADG